jgi:hypothetical protein
MKAMLAKELDLAAYLGGSDVVRVMAVANGSAINVLAKLENDINVSVEIGAGLPKGEAAYDRHEIIAARGVACDRTVDTQVPQASIYQFTAEGEKRYTDTDTELFGFELEEILLIRAAFAVLSKPAMADEWNAIDAKLRKQVADALATEANGKPVIYTEEK